MPLDQNTKQSERLLRIGDVENTIGFKASFIYDRIKSGQFPAPIRVGKAIRWPESLVQNWVLAQIESNKESQNNDAQQIITMFNDGIKKKTIADTIKVSMHRVNFVLETEGLI